MTCMKALNLILTTLWLAMPSLTSYADDKRFYQVELIAFSQVSETGLRAEHWPAIPALDLDSDNLVHLTAAQNQAGDSMTDQANDSHGTPLPTSYLLLPSDELRLNSLAQKIQRQHNYQLLLHIGWRQAFSRKDKPEQVVISNAGSAIATQGWQVNGLLSIDMNHYFDLTFNLIFSAPWAEISRLAPNNYPANLNSGEAYFQLLQKRRTRSGELNYIDHPVFGVFLEFFPLPKPAA